ncbi:hypothetical protein [Acidithiobacillus sp.]
MATVYSREDQDGITIGWQAIVRKNGYPSQTRTFRAKRDAEAWALLTESAMERGLWQNTSDSVCNSQASMTGETTPGIARPYDQAWIETRMPGASTRAMAGRNLLAWAVYGAD